MKILKETTDSQTLRIIPRKYVDTVDLTITNERTNTPVTFSGLAATTNGGYLDIDHVFNLKEDNNYSFEVKTISQEAGVKCIAANNEYLSSPAGNYFGSTIDGLDIEIEYKNFNPDNGNYILTQGQTLGTNVGAFNLIYVKSFFRIQIVVYDDTNTQRIYQFNSTSAIPTNGKIKITGLATNLSVFVDDVLIDTLDASDINGITNIQQNPLLFNNWLRSDQVQSTSQPISIDYTRIKINSKEWTFPEGTGSTTLSNESDVTTLNSDVSTEAMWQEELTSETIYKGKIFCTNQDNYSINNGIYKERGKNNEYVIYE